MLFTYFQGKIKFSHYLWLITLLLSFYFDLVPPFYFPEWNHYFPVNFPNSLCYFWKYKSVFLHILHQSLLLSNITPHSFSAQTLYALVKKSPLKRKFLRFTSAPSQNLSNSCCQFWSDKSIHIQILHHSSVSWKITPLYLFSSRNLRFAQK